MHLNIRRSLLLALLTVLCIPLYSTLLSASDLLKRTELKRADLTGTAGTEVVVARLEAAPGAAIPLHIHHGDEFLYVIEGGTIQPAGKPEVEFPAGRAMHFKRGVPHGGFKVVGQDTITVITVHIVDKGKPLAETVNR